jgi:hypothetical protein
MDKISFNEFTEASKVNIKAEPKVYQYEKTQYVVVDDVLVEPDKLLKYLDKFPALDKEDFLRNGKVISYAPGLQQLISANYLQELTHYFNNLLYPMIGKEFRIDWYTNIFYPDMNVTETARLPHVDTFDMAINIWLTDNHKDDGTAFYKNGDKYYGDSIKYDFVEDKESKWQPFDGNTDYEKYLVVPSKYNTAVIYSGKFYHSAYYVPQTNKERKSLVGALFLL